jgi:hypothetical protein
MVELHEIVGVIGSRCRTVRAVLHTELFEYDVLGVGMIGQLAVEHEAGDGDRPGVLLIHEAEARTTTCGFGPSGSPRSDTRLRPRVPRRRVPAFDRPSTGPSRRALRRSGRHRTTGAGRLRRARRTDGVDAHRLARPGSASVGVMALELARSGVRLRAAIGLLRSARGASTGAELADRTTYWHPHETKPSTVTTRHDPRKRKQR